MAPKEKQKIEIEKSHRDPLLSFNQAVTVDCSDFLGTALNRDCELFGFGHVGTSSRADEGLYAYRISAKLVRFHFCGVEVRRGGVGSAYPLPTLSSVGAHELDHASVFTPRASNRTCGIAASGSRRRLTQSP